jgi:hypothetical protein
VSAARQKGTLAETAFVKYLIDNGFPHAERRALHGTEDKGDVTGTVGLAWEVKNHKTYNIPAWLEETRVERFNAGAEYGLLIIKPNRVGVDKVDQWWCVMPVGKAIDLLREAGFGDPL